MAYLKLGDLHASLSEGPKYDQASTKEAMTYYEDYMILYPGTPTSPRPPPAWTEDEDNPRREQNLHGDFYFYKRNNYTAAKVFYNEAITAFPDSGPAKVAKRRLAELDAKVSKATIKPTTAPKKRFWVF
jgi:outer membrane protein assembly factor BamD